VLDYNGKFEQFSLRTFKLKNKIVVVFVVVAGAVIATAIVAAVFVVDDAVAADYELRKGLIFQHDYKRISCNDVKETRADDSCACQRATQIHFRTISFMF
jgi:hypothetical protein